MPFDEHMDARDGSALFESPRPPFQLLRDGLQVAEERLAANAGGWQRLQGVIGDDAASTSALNKMLVDVRIQLRRGVDTDDYELVVVGPPTSQAEAAAWCAIALLVQRGGWKRLGRCRRVGCERVFVDWSSGALRRQCRNHDLQGITTRARIST